MPAALPAALRRGGSAAPAAEGAQGDGDRRRGPAGVWGCAWGSRPGPPALGLCQLFPVCPVQGGAPTCPAGSSVLCLQGAVGLVATRAPCWMAVNRWPTIGEPSVNQSTVGLHGCQDAQLAHGHLLIGHTLVNQATFGLLGHEGTLLPPSQPLVNQGAVGLHGHWALLLACGHPLATHWPPIGHPLVTQATFGPCGSCSWLTHCSPSSSSPGLLSGQPPDVKLRGPPAPQ